MMENLGIKNSPPPTETIFPKVVKGGFWVFSLRIAERVLDFIKILILARLLLPSDFGLLGIALLVANILGTFTGTGFMSALIQQKEKTEQYLDTAWTVQLIRGLLLFCILFLGAPLAAKFFKTPEANWVIKVLAVTQLMDGFRNIGVVYFKKELEFHKQFIYSFGATLAGLIVSIYCAFLLRNVWALVYGFLAGNIVALILSYVIHPYRPKLDFDIHKAKELFGFGKWVLSFGIVSFFATQGDDIFVGKVLGATMLGFYQMAYTISNLPATEITHVISQVVFPSYSKMQDNIARLREAYMRVLRIVAFLTFPLAVLIFTLAPDFTIIFLKHKWMFMVPSLQVLCLFGLVRAVSATIGPVLYATGKPQILTKLSAIYLVILVVLIYPLSAKWGILGVSWAVVIPSVVNLILFISPLKRTLKTSTLELLKAIFPIIGATIFMTLLLLGMQSLVDLKATIPYFTARVVTGLAVYLFGLYLLDIIFKNQLRVTLVSLLKEIRHGK